jgi:hypothetical protein
MAFGVIYLVVGLAGMIPEFGGSYGMAPSMLFGIASVNVIHNVVHLVIGIAGLSMSRTDEGASTFCKTFGVVLLIVGLLGIAMPNLFGILPIGQNDIWIHLVSGVVLAYAGFAMSPSGRAATSN